MKFICIINLFFFITAPKAASIVITNVDELNIALKTVQAGDSIVIKNGTYNNFKIQFKPKQTGTLTNKIYLIAQTAGKVIFTGNSQIAISGSYLQAEGFSFIGQSTLLDGEDVISFSDLNKGTHTTNHSTIVNCSIIDYTTTNELTNNNWIALLGSYNTISHCHLKGKKNQGPYIVVRYNLPKDSPEKSDAAPSTYHNINHNYFGYRTMPTGNGGECLRIGDSKTSFTKGFNIIEYNFFEDEENEPEVISNKSCYNTYRFNTLFHNDGALVLRHGTNNIVYGNFIDGGGNNKASGIRIINANQTVFNNYITRINSSSNDNLKAPLLVMSGLQNSPINGYYSAENAIVAYNTITLSSNPLLKLGVGNNNKGLPLVGIDSCFVLGNVFYQSTSSESYAIKGFEPIKTLISIGNLYGNTGAIVDKGYTQIKDKNSATIKGIIQLNIKKDNAAIPLIEARLLPHNINLSVEEITKYQPSFITTKEQVGTRFKL